MNVIRLLTCGPTMKVLKMTKLKSRITVLLISTTVLPLPSFANSAEDIRNNLRGLIEQVANSGSENTDQRSNSSRISSSSKRRVFELAYIPSSSSISSQRYVLTTQRYLSAIGYNVGALDGLMGPATQKALVDFKSNNGLSNDGMLSLRVLSVLRATVLYSCLKQSNSYEYPQQVLEFPYHVDVDRDTKNYELVSYHDALEAQTLLKELGYDFRATDGVMDQDTVLALKLFQRSVAQKMTGKLTIEVLDSLRNNVVNMCVDKYIGHEQEEGTSGRKKKEPDDSRKKKTPKEPGPGGSIDPKKGSGDRWTAEPWNTSRPSTSRLVQIKNKRVDTRANLRPGYSSIIPKSAIPIKNRHDFELLTKNRVLIAYRGSRHILSHLGWMYHSDNSKTYLNPTESRPFSRNLKPSNLKHCEYDGKWLMCFKFFRDASYADIIYAQGQPANDSKYSLNIPEQQFVYQLTNEGTIEDQAALNLKRHGENYQVPISGGEIMLELLKAGKQVDDALRGSGGSLDCGGGSYIEVNGRCEPVRNLGSRKP